MPTTLGQKTEEWEEKGGNNNNRALGHANPDGNSSLWGLLSKSPLCTNAHIVFPSNPSHRYDTSGANLPGCRAQCPFSRSCCLFTPEPNPDYVFCFKLSH